MMSQDNNSFCKIADVSKHIISWSSVVSEFYVWLKSHLGSNSSVPTRRSI